MKASRLLALPPYLFEELENRYNGAIAKGRDVIDLSIGDPDLSPPESMLSHLKEALANPDYHRYPPQRGTSDLKASIRRYLSRRGGIEPSDDQILVLIGSKEGLAHLPLSVCNPGDVTLVPEPGYPVYGSSAAFAGCRIETLELDESTGYLPDVSQLSMAAAEGARLCFLNYPNNPTGAAADAEFFRAALEVSGKRELIIANDAAYADLYFGPTSPLLCATKNALDHAMIEFFSFSKMYSITGWRVGFAVGHREVIEALSHLKANIDSGVFAAIQEAVARTLDGSGDAYAEVMRKHYRERRDAATRLLAKHGFHCFSNCATFYLWVRVPPKWTSMEFAISVLDGAGVLVTPGVGFGMAGEGYFRIALTRPLAEIEKGIHRLGRF
ncbi:MAG: aminotransferase class I/II-fold pyridoxal phosphate-dependent enzyme [Candidatus Krumholzibacteria bacterium]|nr:aminotransferase class I/II-fold pyridoxal phosphate-dependent enzyme [Candidatus Krumholzibacteria bacterium]